MGGSYWVIDRATCQPPAKSRVLGSLFGAQESLVLPNETNGPRRRLQIYVGPVPSQHQAVVRRAPLLGRSGPEHVEVETCPGRGPRFATAHCPSRAEFSLSLRQRKEVQALPRKRLASLDVDRSRARRRVQCRELDQSCSLARALGSGFSPAKSGRTGPVEEPVPRRPVSPSP
jgi:hypothetical protein